MIELEGVFKGSVDFSGTLSGMELPESDVILLESADSFGLELERGRGCAFGVDAISGAAASPLVLISCFIR